MAAEPQPVIVVDDDEGVRRSLRFMLELEGLEVRLFDSGEALLLDGDLPTRGCLVVDQKMPRVSGIELIGLLRRDGGCPPAILIAGRLTEDVRSRAAAAGFAAAFEKPLDGSGLIDAIRGALDAPPP